MTQVEDKAFAKGMYCPLPEGPRAATTGRNNLRKLRASLCQAARRYRPGRVLAVVQEAVKEGLLALGNLPGNLDLAHHNAIAGLDGWRDVRALIVVGRTLPGPAAVEAMAAQLTGRAPDPVEGWYPRMQVGRELAGGSVVAVDADRHPDPVAEAVRWQIAEGELVQIIGRGRAVNRTPDTPLDVLVMCDMPLPLPVDRLVAAADLNPSPLDLMLAEGGVALLNPRDAAAAFPGLWDGWEAAKKAIERGQKGTNAYERLLLGVCFLLVRVSYQVAAERRRRVEAVVDLAVVPDPRAWLEARLGMLAHFEQVMDAAPDSQGNPARARSNLAEETMVDVMQDVPAMAAEQPPGPVDDGGLDPGLIYRGPVAWQPPELAMRAGGRLIEVPRTPPPHATPWVLLPTRPAPSWHRALDPATMAEDGVVWWGPLRPVVADGLDGLAFRRRGGPGPAAPTVAG